MTKKNYNSSDLKYGTEILALEERLEMVQVAAAEATGSTEYDVDVS